MAASVPTWQDARAIPTQTEENKANTQALIRMQQSLADDKATIIAKAYANMNDDARMQSVVYEPF